MKYLIPILFLCFFSSCHKDSERTAIRRIINETEFDVEIRIYDDGKAEIFQYEVMAMDSIEIVGSCFFAAYAYESCSLDWTAALEFGEIIFQDSLRLLYDDLSTCDEKAINGDPVGGCYGYKRTTENGILIYSYRITSSDVALATPIN